jgi:ABC-type multidrug transport system fused ATPase/permease subunit
VSLKFLENIKYIKYLIITTPYYFFGISLNFLSSILILMGVPMLLPALDYLEGSNNDINDSMSADLSGFIFSFLNITPTFYSIVIFSSGLIIASQILLFLIEIFNIRIQIKIIKSYMDRLIGGYFSAKWSWISNDKSGAFHSAISREVGMASEAHLDSQRLVTSFLQVFVYIVISLIISVEVTLLAVVFFTMIFLINILFSNKVNRLSGRYNDSFISLSSLVGEIGLNKKFFKYSKSSSFIGIILEEVGNVNTSSWRLNLLITLLSSFSIILGMLFVVSILLFHSEFDLKTAEIVILFLVFARLAPQFTNLAGNYIRISERLPVHKSVNNRIQSIEDNQEVFGRGEYGFKNEILFNSVNFSHEKKVILKNISLEIRPLSTTAFVGKSGAGKSTLLDLILGLIRPNKGVISYGHIEQNELDLKLFRENVAYISQNVTLLDGSLLFNLTIGSVNATMETVMDSCEKAHLMEFIEDLPDKFETVIGENGVKLSGGQRQRIALARVLINKPKMLILDEATSQLDIETEGFIKDAICDLQGELTVIIVAHRLSTIKHADMVYVLELGRIAEYGSYNDLLKRKGRLYSLDKLQQG